MGALSGAHVSCEQSVTLLPESIIGLRALKRGALKQAHKSGKGREKEKEERLKSFYF